MLSVSHPKRGPKGTPKLPANRDDAMPAGTKIRRNHASGDEEKGSVSVPGCLGAPLPPSLSNRLP